MPKLSRIEKLMRKLRKAHIKMLRAYARGLLERGGELEYKSIQLELQLRDEIQNRGE